MCMRFVRQPGRQYPVVQTAETDRAPPRTTSRSYLTLKRQTGVSPHVVKSLLSTSPKKSHAASNAPSTVLSTFHPLVIGFCQSHKRAAMVMKADVPQRERYSTGR